jgi:hypothetical protein
MNLGKNYTKPNNDDYKDKPEDYLFLVMAFGRALSEMLPDGHGIFVELRGDALKINPDAKNVVIFNDGDMMRVVKYEEDGSGLKNGDRIIMIAKNTLN